VNRQILNVANIATPCTKLKSLHAKRRWWRFRTGSIKYCCYWSCATIKIIKT